MSIYLTFKRRYKGKGGCGRVKEDMKVKGAVGDI
jgi:hypothetical protein